MIFDSEGSVLSIFANHKEADANGALVPVEPPTQDGEYGRVSVDGSTLPDIDKSQMTVDDPDNPTEVLSK